MNNQASGEAPQSDAHTGPNFANSQSEKLPVRSKNRKWLVVVGIVAGLIVVWQVIAILLGGSARKDNNSILYEAMHNAAQKRIVLFAQERLNYNSNADLAANKPLSHALSISELDVSNKTYSTAYASFFSRGTANAIRCVKGKEYRTFNRSPDTFDEARDALKGVATPYEYKASQSDIYGPCQYTRSGHAGKFSDGILPVGLTGAQATSWINYYKLHKPLTLKDEGNATVGAYSGHKVSFEIGELATGKPYKTDAFFTAYRDGDTGKTFGLGIAESDIAQHFERLLDGLYPSGAKGFYIIDEQKKLPIYSEISTEADGAQGFQPYVSKQSYRYPDTMTMDEKTQVESL